MALGMLRRLQIQVGLAVAALLAVTTAIFSIVDVRYQTEQARASIAAELTIVARNVATLSAPFLVVEDFAAAEQLVLRIAELPLIANLALTDPSGSVLSRAETVTGVTRSTFAPLHQEPTTVASNIAQMNGTGGPEFALRTPNLSTSTTSYLRTSASANFRGRICWRRGAF